jgi:hypothetical protein
MRFRFRPAVLFTLGGLLVVILLLAWMRDTNTPVDTEQATEATATPGTELPAG